ncbi:MAG TPA: SEC-C metal-binding domain-containing protein, partial [Chroococcales cyanobacterium]
RVESFQQPIEADAESIALVKRAMQLLQGEVRPQAEAKEVARNIKVGKNDPCPCFSGKKFKKCCGRSLWAP